MRVTRPVYNDIHTGDRFFMPRGEITRYHWIVDMI
jgi:hypothetical protein